MNSDNSSKYTRPDDAILRMRLTEDQFAVTQLCTTEPPYFNAYWDEEREGIYADIGTGEPLFLSRDKFHSGGWPAFYKPINRESIEMEEREMDGEVQTEVHSRIGRTHLGYVYPDGPIEHGGLRYTVNSNSLIFIPKERLEQEGYNDCLSYFKF